MVVFVYNRDSFYYLLKTMSLEAFGWDHNNNSRKVKPENPSSTRVEEGFNANEFAKLSNSPEVKRSLEKVLYGCANKSLRKDRDMLNKQDISSICGNIIKQYPSLRLDLSIKFWLNISEKNFSNLSIDKKIILIGLYRTYTKKPNGSKWFLNTFNGINTSINSDINKAISINFNLMQLKNGVNSMFLEKQEAFKHTLKDLGVDEKDIPKFKTYLDMLKKHPKMVQEAWFGTWLIIGLIIWVLLTWAWVYIYNDLTKPNTHTEINTNEWKIENIQEVLKLLLVEADFTKTGTIKKEQFTIDPEGNPIFNIGKEVVNKLQSSEITMEVKGVLGLKYDFSNVENKTKITRSPDGTEYLKVDIYIKNPPEVVILNSTTTVLKKNRERVQLDSFNQIEQEVKTKIETEQIAEAMRPWGFYDNVYPKSMSTLINTLEALFGVWINRTAKVTIHVWNEIYSHPTDAIKINQPVAR